MDDIDDWADDRIVIDVCCYGARWSIFNGKVLTCCIDHAPTYDGELLDFEGLGPGDVVLMPGEG